MTTQSGVVRANWATDFAVELPAFAARRFARKSSQHLRLLMGSPDGLKGGDGRQDAAAPLDEGASHGGFVEFVKVGFGEVAGIELGRPLLRGTLGERGSF